MTDQGNHCITIQLSERVGFIWVTNKSTGEGELTGVINEIVLLDFSSHIGDSRQKLGACGIW